MMVRIGLVAVLTPFRVIRTGFVSVLGAMLPRPPINAVDVGIVIVFLFVATESVHPRRFPSLRHDAPERKLGNTVMEFKMTTKFYKM